MRVIVDAQLSPRTAEWLGSSFELEAVHVKDLGLINAPDQSIFQTAREGRFDLIVTKDQDFQALIERFGPPPQIIWLTCGNCSTQALHQLLERMLPKTLLAVRAGEAIIEIS